MRPLSGGGPRNLAGRDGDVGQLGEGIVAVLLARAVKAHEGVPGAPHGGQVVALRGLSHPVIRGDDEQGAVPEALVFEHGDELTQQRIVGDDVARISPKFPMK